MNYRAKEEATSVVGGFLAIPPSRSNWNLEMFLVFRREINWSSLNKSLGGQIRENSTPTSQPTYMYGTGVLSLSSKLTTNWLHVQKDFWFCAVKNVWSHQNALKAKRQCDCFLTWPYLHASTSETRNRSFKQFSITAENLVRSLANFYYQ